MEGEARVMKPQLRGPFFLTPTARCTHACTRSAVGLAACAKHNVSTAKGQDDCAADTKNGCFLWAVSGGLGLRDAAGRALTTGPSYLPI